MPVGKALGRPEDPIGIFDSGIGGLTVAKAICKLLPKENIIYFGDTAHMPYGEKSAHAIKSYAEGITSFLLSKNCKLIVVACNSASATAFKNVLKLLPDKKMAINVIDPVVESLAKNEKFKTIGLIGTKRTVSSAVYKKKFHKKNPDMKLKSLATPLLAPMVEEGFFNNNISRSIVFAYLNNTHLKNIDAIILACTHYPLIEKEINSFYEGKTAIINSADIVARDVKKYLTEHSLLKNTEKTTGRFIVSDYTKSFEESARIFFGKNVKLKEENLWG